MSFKIYWRAPYLGNTKHESSEIAASVITAFSLMLNSSNALVEAVKCSG